MPGLNSSLMTVMVIPVHISGRTKMLVKDYNTEVRREALSEVVLRHGAGSWSGL